MDTAVAIGRSIQRKEAWDKVTGVAKYTDDFLVPGILHAKLVTSTYAHAKIKSIDTSEAFKAPGVQTVVTGSSFPILSGVVLEDRPPLAIEKVRYFGEPIVLVVANSEREAMHAVKLVKVEYDPLPVVNSPRAALKSDAPLIHENLDQYKHAVEDVSPEPNTNIAERIKIRKGDMAKGWAESEFVIEAEFALPKSDHIAMETRNARAEIHADGQVVISSSTQAPFSVRNMISQYFGLELGKIIVKTPLVGGAFGGKAPVQLEILAYMASKSVGGRIVKIANSREEDIVTSPCRLGLEAKIKLGASGDGVLKAAEMTYLVDTGAYTDIGPRLAKSIAIGCTGPYDIENVWCDSLCIYTNHPYATSFRGFGHASNTFCIERTMDKLAFALGVDPMELRIKNAITPDKTTLTLGGNIGGTIIYREAVMPLLLSDSYVLVAAGDKLKQIPIHEIFNERLRLQKGEFIVQFIIGKEFTALPFVHVKKTKSEKIDYPLISITAIKKDGTIRLAMSGVCPFPFHSVKVEECLNEKSIPWETRAANVLESLPAPVLNDVAGSDSYRKFVLKNTLINTLETMEEM